MKEHDGNQWIHLFTQRLEQKNLRAEELDMIEDFTISLSVIRAFGADPENPLVKMHLHKAGHILRHFTDTIDTDNTSASN